MISSHVILEKPPRLLLESTEPHYKDAKAPFATISRAGKTNKEMFSGLASKASFGRANTRERYRS